MMTDVKEPTHYRLMTSLKAVGPYIREGECQPGQYWFDCLSVCVDDKKSPELREFWGWWLDLNKLGNDFVANYTLGQYDEKGEWLDILMPENIKKEVEKTLEGFHFKLVDVLSTTYGYNVTLHENSSATVL